MKRRVKRNNPEESDGSASVLVTFVVAWNRIKQFSGCLARWATKCKKLHLYLAHITESFMTDKLNDLGSDKGESPCEISRKSCFFIKHNYQLRL